jgi:hypothetical protein
MSNAQAVDNPPPVPLRGPDFVLDKVASWVEHPGTGGELVLHDGSTWKVKPGTKMYPIVRDTITAAIRAKRELFVSGDRTGGRVEIVLDSQRLSAQEIGSKEPDGRYAVLFQGPPSVYYLRSDRPWFGEAMSLLQRSATSGASFGSPDLLIAIDPRDSEIVAVKPINSSKAGASR